MLDDVSAGIHGLKQIAIEMGKVSIFISFFFFFSSSFSFLLFCNISSNNVLIGGRDTRSDAGGVGRQS